MENRTPENLKGGELRPNEGEDTWERARQRGLMEDCRTVHPVRYKPNVNGSQTAPPAQYTPARQNPGPAPLPVLTPARTPVRTPGPCGETSISECDKRLLSPLPVGTPIGPKTPTGCPFNFPNQVEVETSPTWGRSSLLASTPQRAPAADFSMEVGDSGKVVSKLFKVFEGNTAKE